MVEQLVIADFHHVADCCSSTLHYILPHLITSDKAVDKPIDVRCLALQCGCSLVAVLADQILQELRLRMHGLELFMLMTPTCRYTVKMQLLPYVLSKAQLGHNA